MWVYLLRRILLMVPTLIGILIITFGISRCATDPLQTSMSADFGAEGGLDPLMVGQTVEAGLRKARRTGQDLPALINLRGFTDRQEVVDWLWRLEREPGMDEADRIAAGTRLWLQGRWILPHLVAIIADEDLAELHGPASLAFSFAAYRPLLSIDTELLSTQHLQAITVRNNQLKNLRIAFDNDPQLGYVTLIADTAAHRQRLLAFWDQHAPAYAVAPGERWGAILFETGFVDFFARFFTGRLESEQFKRPVFALIGERWYVSFWLQFFSVLIAWCVAVPLGIRSARRNGSLEDRTTTTGLFLLWSLPDFFVGSLLLFYFATDRADAAAWFPNRGLSSDGSLWFGTPRYLLDLLWHAFLPLIVLTYASFTVLSRYMRGQLLDQFGADYARSARAKGCDEDRVVYGHCLRNSMVTMITLGSGLLTALFGGFVIVEYIFSINGLGLLLLDAARAQDTPLIMGSTIISVTLLLVSILVADVLYAVVDPRIRGRFA